MKRHNYHKTIAVLVVAFCVCSATMYGQETADSLKNIKLDEVEVKADNYRVEKDHEVLYMTKQNKSFGTNALNAISSLNRFTASINGTTLMSWDKQEVFILIDGVPSTGMDLCSYKADDIKKIEYYQFAPPQYKIFTNGPVVNIVLKRKSDHRIAGYFNTMNSITSGWGVNFGSVSYTDSLNMVKLDYDVVYNDSKSTTENTEFVYSPSFTTQYSGRKHTKNQGHTLKAIYQRYQGRHLFNAKVSLLHNPGTESAISHSIFNISGEQYPGTDTKKLQSKNQSAALSLYYGYHITNTKLFAIQVTNILGRDKSTIDRQNRFAPQFSYLDSRFNQQLTNHNYQLSVAALCYYPMLGGTLTASNLYTFYRQSTIANQVKNIPHSHNNLLYTGMAWRIKNQLTIAPYIGVNTVSEYNGASRRTTVTPYGNLFFNWWPNSVPGFNTQVQMSYSTVPPFTHYLNEIPSFIDYWLYQVGNRNLKNSHKLIAIATVAYYFPKTNNAIYLKIYPQYVRNPIGPVFEADADGVTQHIANYKYLFSNAMSLSGSWDLFKCLKIQPYLDFGICKFETPNQKVTHYQLRPGGGITFFKKDYEISVTLNPRVKRYDGDISYNESQQFSVGGQYKYRGWSFGARWRYYGHNNIQQANHEVFRFKKVSNSKSGQYDVSLTATYSFSVGKSRNHQQQVLNSQEIINGLNSYQMPSTSR